MRFGLSEDIIEKLTQVFEANPKVDKSFIFGSRAKGNYRPDSDIDIAVKGMDITQDNILKMQVAMEEKGIGYKVDLLNYETIKEKAIVEHIDRVGIEVYNRNKLYSIGMVGSVITGKTPSSKFPDEFGSYMPFITPTDYNNYNKWILHTERMLSEKGVLKLANKVLPPNSIMVTCIGSDMGKVAMNKYKAVTNQQLNSIVPFKFIDSNFLFYKLIDLYDILRMYGQAGSALPILNKGDFENIEILIPRNRIEQEVIAEVLSSFDDKINLLHHQNKTLEELAQILFKQWFMEELDNSTPMHSLEEFITFNPRERIDKSKDYNFFEMKCLSNEGMTIADGEKRNVSSGSSFRNFDTLLAKITPCLENGKTGFVMLLDENEVARGSTEFIVMRSKDIVSPYWIYCLARNEEFREKAIQSMTGTSGRQRVQIDLLKRIPISIDTKKMQSFHQIVTPFFQKIKENQIQIYILTQLRDNLLPKLMSGEIRVSLD